MNPLIQSATAWRTQKSALDADLTPQQENCQIRSLPFRQDIKLLLACLVGFVTLNLLSLSSLHAATFTQVFGSNSDPEVAFITLEFPDPSIGNLVYQVGFDSATNGPFDSFQAFDIIEAGDSRISFQTQDFNFGGTIFTALLSITFEGTSYGDFNSGPFWEQWSTLGTGGFPSSGIPGDDWTLGGGGSFPAREFVSGSNEYWKLAEFTATGVKPSVDAIVPLADRFFFVPEPSAIALLALALGCLSFSRRRK